jgi:glucose/arabinose dehydrogenase
MVPRIPSGSHVRVSLQTALSLFLAAAASGCGSQFESETPDLPEGPVPVTLAPVASGLVFPLYLTAPPGDPRLFIVEKGGTIRIVENGALLPTPFLDLSALVSTGGEQGLLGLAFDPQYAANGRFVVHYTDLAGDTRVSLLRVSQDPNVADAASELLVLAADQPFPNHNGGQVLFGPDGYLYVTLGDGGSSGDPGDRGQSLADLLGSILRIQPLEAGGYAVPSDNPFVGVPDVRPEIWSYGVRNPWRVDIDAPTGDFYVADVGQGQWEEVSVSTGASGGGRGANFGWRIMEGPECFATGSCDQSGLELPVVWYDHGRGCSITGGFVYRGSAIPELQGHYFYSDYCSGFVRSFRLEDGAAVDQYNWPTLAPGTNVPGFGRDASGELYILGASGVVYRIVRG